MKRWRSLLFVPADNGERVAKAATRQADAIILDLEDGVAPEAKPAARATLAASAALLRGAGADVVVRINASWRDATRDLDVAVGPDTMAIMVPKSENPERLAVVSAMIAELEAERGLNLGQIALIALIESPAAFICLHAIAELGRVAALAFGSEDFSLSLGVPPTPECLDLPCRQIALAAATRNLSALAVPISIGAFRDEAGWRAATERARAFGATGALCIHPSQVAIANSEFGISNAERDYATRVIAAWDARPTGQGVIQIDGRMIDRPVVERARNVVATTQ